MASSTASSTSCADLATLPNSSAMYSVGEAFDFALQSYDALLCLSGVGVEFENYLLLAYSHVMSLEMRTAIHPKSRRIYTSLGSSREG